MRSFLVLLLAEGMAFIPNDFIPNRVLRARQLHKRTASASVIAVDVDKPMGIVFEENPGQGGLYVFDVSPDSAASNVGVLPGDQLLKCDGKDVSTFDFDTAMEELQAAPSPAKLEFARSGTTEEQAAPPKKTSTGLTTVTVKAEETKTVNVSGEKILRTALQEAKVDIYTFSGKLTNCNGGGQCGTCVVDVVSSDPGCFSDKTPAEKAKLKNKSPSFRLACQVVCKGGDATIQTKP